MNLAGLLTYGNFIGGKWLKGSGPDQIKVLNKYEQTVLGEIPLLGISYKEEILKAAVNGFQVYRKTSAGERAAKLQTFMNLIQEDKEFFIDLIIKEAGKPRSYATVEVDRCLSTVAAAIRECYNFTGELVPIDFNNGAGKTAFTKRFPCGVVFCITPFNFPINLLMHKIAPALAVGCSVIIKPPPQTPLSAIALVQLLEKVGYAPGVINLVQADISLAEEIVKDSRVSMISFTGSDTVGWHLKNICGKKKVALELGGNASVIVEDSQHLPAIAKTIASGAYLFAGQICISTQRILVNTKLKDEFLKLLLQEIKALKVGDPNDGQTIVGPLIDRKSYDRVLSWVNEAINGGAKLLSDFKYDPNRNLIEPVLLGEVQKGLKVVCREVFGPVAVLETYQNFEDAIQMVNDSEFGLQAGVFTDSVQKMKYAFDNLEVGGVIMNNIPGFRMDNMPYGGVKNSGFGREGVRYVMEEMTEPRLIVY